MPTLSDPAERLAQLLQQSLGLDLNVIRAWVALESRWGQSKLSISNMNYLNKKCCADKNCIRLVWCQYSSVEQAAADTVSQLKRRPEWYGPILAAPSKPPSAQVAAFGDTPWSEDRYGGSGAPNLAKVYNAVVESYGGEGAIPTHPMPAPTPGDEPRDPPGGGIFGIGDMLSGFWGEIKDKGAKVGVTVGLGGMAYVLIVVALLWLFKPQIDKAAATAADAVIPG